MIIARSPLRISFSGGGTDLPAFFKKYGPGVVVSTSINKHVYVTLAHKFDGKVSVRYRIHENVDHVDELKHPLIRETLKHYGIERGIEIVIISDVPARGSGLGASSALAVALCAALEVFVNGRVAVDNNAKRTYAEVASEVEIRDVGSPIGLQDHYASALGGLNKLTFSNDDRIGVERFQDEEFLREIECQSMLFYLNLEHEYNPGEGHFVQRILKDQMAEIESKRATYELQRDNALRMWEHMAYAVPERFMDHINENWRLKRSLHKSITNDAIDEIVQRAYAAGATAAKVCGAGGGGFLYLLVPASMQPDVRLALAELSELRFKFDQRGVEVIFNDGQGSPK